MRGVNTKVVAAGGLALTVALGVAGCGQVQKMSAKQSVEQAFSGLGDAKAAGFTVKLDTTAADLQAISAAEGEKLKADDLKAVQNVLAGDIAFTVQAPAGKTLGESGKETQAKADDAQSLAAALKEQGNFSATAHLNGAALIDLRTVNGVLYARADGPKILQLAEEDPAQLDQALTDLPPALRPVAKAAHNQWVSVDLAAAIRTADENGALKDMKPSGSPTPTPTLDAGKLQRLVDSVKAAFDKQATMTEIGSDDARGQGYRLGAPAKRIAQAVSDDLIALVGKEAETEIRRGITAVPDKTFYLEVWVKDDKLTAIRLDLTQFLDKPVNGKKLAIDVAVNTSPAAVTAPAGATPLDVKAIMDELPRALASVSGMGPGAGGMPLGGSLSKAEEKQARDQLKQAGLSNAEIDRILGV
jgi:hypothetical protein